jgi:hypothetical protein
MYHMAAGALFWLLVPILGIKWRLAARRYGTDRERYLVLFRAAMADGLRSRATRSHDEVLRLAGHDSTG